MALRTPTGTVTTKIFDFLRQKFFFPWFQILWGLWLRVHHLTKLSLTMSLAQHTRTSWQPFPSGFCWKFHQGESVLAATSNMNALDVKFSIQQCNVLSPADNKISLHIPPCFVPCQHQFHSSYLRPIWMDTLLD